MKASILFIMHFPPPVNGGASVMGNAIKQSSLINETFNTDYINPTTSFSLDDIGKNAFRKILTTLKILAKVIKSLYSNKYDLCYMVLPANGYGFYKGVAIILALKVFKKKIIYHFHNKGIACAGNKKSTNYLYQFVFNNTQSIILSPLLYSDISAYVKPKDVYVCPNGIPEIDTGLSVKPSAEKDTNICSLLFLSNMMMEKGVFVLLEACAILQKRNIPFTCHFVGDWIDISPKQFAEFVSKNNLSKIVFAYGPKYGHDKSSFLINADIFVFPTYFHNETFGLVNLEAMQYGLPIVSTYEGGIPDVIANGISGLLVAQKDIDALADKIELLITKPELRVQMGQEGKKRYHEFFTLEKFERNLVDILKSAIDREQVAIKNELLKETKISRLRA
jgi:glycosyltransferase involved in cell wall biosynthesis